MFKKLKIYSFLVSNKFIVLANVIVMTITIAIWLLFGVIEEAIYNTNGDPNKERVILIEGGMLVFSQGCSMNINTVIIVGCQALFFTLIEIVFLILALLSDRDTWHVKIEAIIQIILQFIAAIGYIVVGRIQIFDTLIDFLVPYANWLFYYLLSECLICVILPILFAIVKDEREKRRKSMVWSSSTTIEQESTQPKSMSDLERILNDKKTFDILLDFGRRSYCTESILCYQDIEKFKRSKNKKMALHIVKTYLSDSSPLELNMPKVTQRGQEILQAMEEHENDSHVFDSIREHCLMDMKDVFERLKSKVSKQEGKFIRSPSKFRNQVTSHTIPNSDSNGTNEQFNSKFPVEADRYTLYLAHACPWCHRTDLVRVLKGLESVIRVIYVDPILTDQGWRFSQPETDSGLNATLLREIYLQSDPNYEGKCTVPVLYDRKQHLIVNNESSEIIRMMNEQFNELATRNRKLDLYPFEFRKEIDLVNSWIYENINDGVYKCGFAQTQYAYEEAFHALFKALLKVENILSRQRYLVAGVKHLTEADIRLVVTLLRFDAVYYTHFKCNLKTLRFGFPNLHNYMKDVYQSFDGILKSTFHVEKTKQHYFGSHRKINPFGIVPLGPELDLDSPPANREFSQIHETVNH